MDKLEGILNLAAMLIGVVCIVAWIVGVVHWDGKYECDEKDCDTCPFPCDRRDKHGLP